MSHHHHHHHHQVNRRGAYLQSPAPLDFVADVTPTSLGYFYASDISTLLHYGYAVSEPHYSRYINHNPLSYVRHRSINSNRAASVVPPRRGSNSEWRGTFWRQNAQESDESPSLMHSNWSREEETMILNGIDRVGGSSEDTNAGVSEEVVSKYLRTRNCDRVIRAADDDEEPEICVVCQDDLFDENQTIAALDCRHEFHTPCIKSWLIRKNACPLCKSIALPYR